MNGDSKQYEIGEKRPIADHVKHSFWNFDIKAAGILMTILGLASYALAENYFVTVKQYDTDQLRVKEAYEKDQKSFAAKLDEIGARQNEANQDIKKLLMRRNDP